MKELKSFVLGAIIMLCIVGMVQPDKILVFKPARPQQIAKGYYLANIDSVLGVHMESDINKWIKAGWSVKAMTVVSEGRQAIVIYERY